MMSRKITPIRDKVLVINIESGSKMTRGGIIVPDDDGKERGNSQKQGGGLERVENPVLGGAHFDPRLLDQRLGNGLRAAGLQVEIIKFISYGQVNGQDFLARTF